MIEVIISEARHSSFCFNRWHNCSKLLGKVQRNWRYNIAKPVQLNLTQGRAFGGNLPSKRRLTVRRLEHQNNVVWNNELFGNKIQEHLKTINVQVCKLLRHHINREQIR